MDDIGANGARRGINKTRIIEENQSEEEAIEASCRTSLRNDVAHLLHILQVTLYLVRFIYRTAHTEFPISDISLCSALIG